MKWEDDSGKHKSEEWDVGAKFATELEVFVKGYFSLQNNKET